MMEAKKSKTAEKIFQRVLKNIKPSKAEARETVYNVNKITSRLKEIVPKSVEIMVVGSIARSTNLSGDSDVDIFMLFDRNVSRDALSKKGLEYGKMLVDPKKGESFEIKYAEHPYVRAYFKSGIKADLVPASKVESAESMATSVDRTPMHNEFVNSTITERQRDEVRLLKFLLKAHSIYGAEAKIGGFSGYLCELLIIQFGSLIGFLEWAAKTKMPVVLYPTMKKVMADDLETSKKFSRRFVVIDPVDINRNVAAAVSEESFAKLVLIARSFISKPDISAFYAKGFSSEKTNSMLRKFIGESGLDLLMLEFEIKDKSAEILWPQANKTAYKIEDILEKNGFAINFSISWIEKRNAFILVAMPKQKIGSRLIRGPDVFKTHDTAQFIKKHSAGMGFVIKESTIYSLEKSRYSDAEKIFRDIAKGKVIEKHKDINLKNAKVYVNRIPERHSGKVYSELRTKLNLQGFGGQ